MGASTPGNSQFPLATFSQRTSGDRSYRCSRRLRASRAHVPERSVQSFSADAIPSSEYPRCAGALRNCAIASRSARLEVASVFWARNRLSLCDGSPSYAALLVGSLKRTASGVRASGDECGRCRAGSRRLETSNLAAKDSVIWGIPVYCSTGHSCCRAQNGIRRAPTSHARTSEGSSPQSDHRCQELAELCCGRSSDRAGLVYRRSRTRRCGAPLLL